jgi:nucleotide-binding universal stress UspA family protein
MSYTIVVGTDGSPAAEQAVLATAELSSSHPDAEVHVVFAADTVPITIPASLLPMVENDWVKATNEASQTALERALALLEDRGVTATPHLVRGEPASCLQRVCEDTGADLLVIGKQGARRSRQFLVGSTAERCVRHASCSVFVVAFNTQP